MSERQTPVLIYTTWPDAASAQQAGRTFVATRLAACVNILSECVSIYEWQGEVQHGTECPMLIKTTERRVDEIAQKVRDMHPSGVPAFIVLPINGGDSEFLNWIAAQVSVPPGLEWKSNDSQ